MLQMCLMTDECMSNTYFTMTDGDSDDQSAICALMTLEGKCTNIHSHCHQNIMEEYLHVLAGGCILILHVGCKNY